MEKEALIIRRKKLVEQLDKANKNGNFVLCINLGKLLNVIDEELRKMNVDVNHIN